MRKLTKNRIFNFIRDNGGYFGIIGAISMTLSALISFLLNISVNPNFNIVSYAVSDLISGPMISRLIYSTGLLISSFCQLPTYISLMSYFNIKERHKILFKFTTLSSLLSIFSHNILSLVPLERSVLPLFLTHGIAAGTHYVAGTISLILIGQTELLSRKKSKVLTSISYITGALYILVWLRYLLSQLVGIPDLFMNNAIQWFALTGVILWSFSHGLFLLKAKKKIIDRIAIKKLSI